MQEVNAVSNEKSPEAEDGFLKTNGKKFIVVLAGGVAITYLAATGHVDPFYAVLYWFGAGSVSAGAITR